MSVILFAERGDLLSYDFLDDIDKETAQAVLNSFIPTAPNVIYDLEMYSITYETIDQFGNEAIASGAIVIPVNQLETLPLLSFHHGTQVRRSGITPKRSHAKLAPSLPNPVITSSKIRRIPCLVQISRSRSKYPIGGIRTPVEPAIGSTITAAMLAGP